MKKFLLITIFGLFTVINAMAQDGIPHNGTCGENLTWEFDAENSVLTISGTGDMEDYFNYGMAPWRIFNISYSFTQLNIADGVTSIGNNAFSDCTSLTSITIPNGVTNIGDGAFAACINLTTITIPNTVKNIGNNTFIYCHGLTSITIPEGVTSIGNRVFNYCSSLISIAIPSSVTSIGYGVFSGCEFLERIECHSLIPPVINEFIFENVTYYRGLLYVPAEAVDAYKAAEGWKNFKTILTIGQEGGVTENLIWVLDEEGTLTISGIGAMPNYSRENYRPSPWREFHSLIRRVVISEGVTNIGDEAFYGCGSLVSIIIPDRVTSIGNKAFQFCRDLTLIAIPNSVTSIGDEAFAHTSLTSIIIPEGVTSIGNGTFNNCLSLTSITIPNGVTSIGNEAFKACVSLTSITIPNSVVSIGDEAFGSCTGLTSITIPNNVTSIGSYVFVSCWDLKRFECQSLIPPTINENTFHEINKTECELYVPAESVDAYKTAEVWKDFNILAVEEGTGISFAEVSPIRIYSTEGNIVVENAPISETLHIYNVSGILVKKQHIASPKTTIALPQGMYIVKVGSTSFKIKH